MNTMKCSDKTIKEFLPAYLEETIGKADRQRVKQHLDSCEDCRSELSLLRMMSAEPVPDPGEAFWASMPAKIQREVRLSREQKKTRLQGLFDRFLLPRWALAAAATAAVVLISWLIVRPVPVDISSKESPSQEETVAEEAVTFGPVDLEEATPIELNAATQWAQNQFEPIGEAIDDVREDTDRQATDELSTLSTEQLDKVYEMLKNKEQELKKRRKMQDGKDLA